MRPFHLLLALLIACDKPVIATPMLPTSPGTTLPTGTSGTTGTTPTTTGDCTAGDADGDGQCDDVDPCPADNPNDSDSDGVCDSADQCPGEDDTLDTDGDTVIDCLDVCPLDNPDDTDNDLVCDSDDRCPGFADGFDPDGDGIPENCDPCPGENPNDDDGDGICNSVDVCPNGDDHFDLDSDGVPDGCDPCPLDVANDSDGDGSCDSADTCPGYVDGAPDADGDGFTIAAGDCDDCNPARGPQNFDIPGSFVDEDCDGLADNPPAACDAGIALTSTDPFQAAAAMDICTNAAQGYGLANARWVRANGSTLTNPGAQVGMLSDLGAIGVQFGSRMAGFSSGYARDLYDPGNCGSLACQGTGPSNPPAGFPQDVAGCAGGTTINDDVALRLDLVAPANAVGFKLRFYFLSFEWPEWVCSEFNDQFILLMNPAPAGAINGNIAIDSRSNPVSVNLAYLGVCDPGSSWQFARYCASGCPSLPSPYCPDGAGDLTGTGFDAWAWDWYSGDDYAGGTGWLEVAAPVTPGQAFSLRLAIWDTGDQYYDSTVLMDHFEWVADPVSVGVQQPP